MCAAFADQARAGGGANIAGAPIVTPGQQEFGNTGDGAWGGCEGASWWNLPLIVGDRVAIDWETATDSRGGPSADTLDVWPIGTTDFSINNTHTFESFEIGANDKQESTFTANGSGTFRLMFVNSGCDTNDNGAYDFTLNVSHRIVLLLPPLTRITTTGSQISVQVHSADGNPVTAPNLTLTLEVFWQGKWHALGSRTPTNGLVRFGVSLPRSLKGSTVKLRVQATGSGYQSATTATRRAFVSR